QAAAHQVAPEAVDEVLREQRIVLRGQPIGELAAAVELVVGRFAAERLRLHDRALPRMADLAGRPWENDRLTAEDAELVGVLRAQPSEEGGQPVVIVLAPFLERVVMALGALDTRAEEDLRGRLGPVLGVTANLVEVRRAFGKRAALGEQDVA